MPVRGLPNQDPVPLESLLDMFERHREFETEAVGNGILHLSSVINDIAVKDTVVVKRPAVLKNVAMMLMQPAFYRIHYEILMILGECCRREDLQEASSKPDLHAAIHKTNAVAKEAVVLLATQPWLHSALQDIIAAGNNSGSKDAAPSASDLLEALPPKAATAEEALAAWTPERQERCCHLMFLDERYRLLEYAPFIARASPWACANCSKMKTERDAKGSRGAQYNRCAQCKAVFYCSAECQKTHWKSYHKPACAALKNGLEDGFKRAEGSVAAFTSLFYPNRAFVYLQRPELSQNVAFDDFFLQYTAGTS